MINALIKTKEKQWTEDGYIEFTQDELDRLSPENVIELKNRFHGRAMMILPEPEIIFFQWLEKNDKFVWNDLWESEENSYQVSIDFLHHFTKRGNGFPICDLINEDNYWFCSKHIKPEGLGIFDIIKKKINQNAELTFDEALLTEIMRKSIDIWHFCYRYNVPVKIAKRKVQEMSKNNLLVHLTARDDLVKYLDV